MESTTSRSAQNQRCGLVRPERTVESLKQAHLEILSRRQLHDERRGQAQHGPRAEPGDHKGDAKGRKGDRGRHERVGCHLEGGRDGGLGQPE
jgi:hypothetical protein